MQQVGSLIDAESGGNEPTAHSHSVRSVQTSVLLGGEGRGSELRPGDLDRVRAAIKSIPLAPHRK